MEIIVSPSEVGMLCLSIRDRMYKFPVGSNDRYEYSQLLGMLCDEVELHFSDRNQEWLYQMWLEEYDMITPY